jgi:hypothetical protein
LGDDLASIFNNDLVGFKGPHGSNPVSLVGGFHDLHTIVVAIALSALLELCKWTVVALVRGELTVGTVTLIGHDAIVACFATPIFCQTIAVGIVLLIPLP